MLSRGPPAAVPNRPRSPLWVRLSGGVLSLAGVLLMLGFFGFAVRLATVEAPPTRHADGLVVLTGGADRVSDAIALLADGQADRLLITGVNPATTPESLTRRLPKLRTLVDCCVTLGYLALDTAGNARETAQWVTAHHIHSLIVVTSNYHMPRALAEIGHAVHGIELVAYPVVADAAKDSAWWSDPRQTRLIASEYLKYVFVKFRQALFPLGGPTTLTVVATGAN